MKHFSTRTFALSFLTIGLLGCATSPTGRTQFIAVPAAEMNQMGETAFLDMKKKVPINHDPKVNAYVKCVADEITNSLPEKQNWEVVVFEVAEPNAFALPGGKIGVHTGMLKIAKDPAQLAAVLGHEVGHVLSNHSNERASESLALSGLSHLSGLFVNKDSKYFGAAMAVFGIGAQYGVVLPHSRRQETEADVVGLDLMSKAGFDPRQAVVLWQNMQAAGGGAPPEFMSTHPANETRIQTLQSKMPPALATFQANPRRSTCKL